MSRRKISMPTVSLFPAPFETLNIGNRIKRGENNKKTEYIFLLFSLKIQRAKYVNEKWRIMVSKGSRLYEIKFRSSEIIKSNVPDNPLLTKPKL